MTGFFIWAHRGASLEAPENTLAAFEAAVEAGADGVELDVQLTRDGVPVVLHDARLDRTTDGRGPVRAQGLRQIRKLDAGLWFHPDFQGERVPTLQEVLDWAGPRIRLNLELKDVAAAGAVLALQRMYPQVDTVLSSFNRRLLKKIRRVDERQAIAVLVDHRFWRRALADALVLQAESFNPRADLLGPAMIAACRKSGLKVYPWTVDLPVHVRQLRRLGADGLFSNDPLSARQSLETVTTSA